MEEKVKLAVIETKLERIEVDVSEIKVAVKDLTTFKLKVLGAGMLGGFLISVLFKVLPYL